MTASTRAPRVVGTQTNMEAAAIAAKARALGAHDTSAPLPDIDWGYPAIHNGAPAALDQVQVMVERLGILLESTNHDLNDLIVDNMDVPAAVRDRAFKIRCIFTVAEEKLDEIHRATTMIGATLWSDKREGRRA